MARGGQGATEEVLKLARKRWRRWQVLEKRRWEGRRGEGGKEEVEKEEKEEKFERRLTSRKHESR